MAGKKLYEDRERFDLRIPPSLKKKLGELAKEKEIPLNTLIHRLILKSLETEVDS